MKQFRNLYKYTNNIFTFTYINLVKIVIFGDFKTS